MEQGRSEYRKLSDEDRASIVNEFHKVTSGLKKGRLKNKFGRTKSVAMTTTGRIG